MKKTCNFLVEDAQADLSGFGQIGVSVPDEAISAVVDVCKQICGGLWVGGSAEISEEGLTFVPNAMNAFCHKGDNSALIPLNHIEDVTVEKAFITNIIVVKTSYANFKLRCFGARDFASEILRIAKTSRGGL